MAHRFQTFHFHVEPGMDREAINSARGVAGDNEFASDEEAARFYLAEAMEGADEGFRNLLPPERISGPELQLLDETDSPIEDNRVIRFTQSHEGVPIFGSRIVVELGAGQDLVSVDLKTTDVEDMSPTATLSSEQALNRLAEYLNIDAARIADHSTQLVFFDGSSEDPGTDDRIVLAYLVEGVPHPPPEGDEESETLANIRGTLSPLHPSTWTYFLDGHTGEVVFEYPDQPTLGPPTRCGGVDDLGVDQAFLGFKTGSTFRMLDPSRCIATLDLVFGRTRDADGASTVESPTTEFDNRAAVSAHVNATNVHDFYEAVLHRSGIDGRGMNLESVVNCTKTGYRSAWVNACWDGKRMLYGQREISPGNYQSLAVFLDVIAHELMHGVTQYTAGLVYKNETGALNESFSDIFGVIINNWYRVGPDSEPEAWDWEIGPGLGRDGEPLRDLSNPNRRNQPAHWCDRVVTRLDEGGVHINSGIHNLAAYNLLTSRDADGQYRFPAKELAAFYYSTLQRLTAQATFSETLQTMRDINATYHAGDPELAATQIAALEDAYRLVGID